MRVTPIGRGGAISFANAFARSAANPLLLHAMLRKYWLELRSSLWFIPGLLVFAGISLAVALIEIDQRFADPLARTGWRQFLGAGADGARDMLSAIAGSMITVAGVAFSVTIVTLSLASTQYTPRILRNFMRDRANQTVLGVFVGIFAYSLVVLRTIRSQSDSGDAFVPLLAVFFAVLLALVAIGFLIFFIHHTAASIQASYILYAITRETLEAMMELFPEELGEEEDHETARQELSGTTWHAVSAPTFGYLQSVDTGELIAFACERDMLLRIERHVGDFVVDGSPLLSSDRPLDADSAKTLLSLFVIGDFRTVEQDAGFGIRQIVDIAMKALSPGVNDTSTAVSCLDYLSVILTHLAKRRIESAFREAGGKLRVIAPAPGYTDYVAKAFDEIRLSAAANVSILLQMLCSLHRVVLVTGNAARRAVLAKHACLIAETASRTVSTVYDRERINSELRLVREALGMSPDELPLLPEKCPLEVGAG